MAGLDLEPGLRWSALRDVRGDVDPQRLVGELPATSSGLRCLSWGVPPAGEEPSGPEPVLSAVRAAVELSVLDLPRPATPAIGHQRWWGVCDAVVLVVEASVTGIGAATAVAPGVEGLAGIVLRLPTPLPDKVIGATLGAPVLARLGEDRTVRVILERGGAVGSDSGPLADAADEVLECVLPRIRAA